MAKMQTPAMKRLQRYALRHQGKGATVSPAREAWRSLRRNKAAMVALVIILIFTICALIPQLIAPHGFDEQNYSAAFTFPCAAYPLGTDNLGRDILSRLIWGAQMSMLIGFVSVGLGLVMGGLFGAVAAFYGGKIDNFIMRVMDILMAIPSMLLAIAIAASLGTGLFNMMLAISISDIPRFARVVRGSIMTIKEREFVEAARSIGASDARLILRHLIPNALAPIIVQATLGIAGAILSACGLSFLGLGIQPPTAEWGTMLSSARQYIRSNWYMVTFPGVTIMLVVGMFNLLGDGLRDALDPRLKR